MKTVFLGVGAVALALFDEAFCFTTPAFTRPTLVTRWRRGDPDGTRRGGDDAARSHVALGALVDPNLYIPDGVHVRSWLGFLGGSVGVFGTLLSYEKGRYKVTCRRPVAEVALLGWFRFGACLRCASKPPM